MVLAKGVETLAAQPNEGRVGEERGPSPMLALADRLKSLKDEKDALREETKKVNAAIEDTMGKLVNIMLEQEIGNFTRGDKQFVLTTKTYISTQAGKKEAVMEWMKAHGLADIVKEDIPSQTLAATVREMLDDDELDEELAQLLNIFEKNEVAVRANVRTNKGGK